MGSCAPCPPCPPLPHAALQHSWTLSAQTLGLLAQSIPAEVLGHPPCPLHALGHRRGKKGQRGAVLGRGWVSPHPQGQDGARSHSLQGSGFQELSLGSHLRRAQHPAQQGWRQTWSPGCKPQHPEHSGKTQPAPSILSPTHTAAHIISTTARGEIYINDPLSFLLLKAAGCRVWQPGSCGTAHRAAPKGSISSTHGPVPALCPVTDQPHFYSSLKRDKSNL